MHVSKDMVSRTVWLSKSDLQNLQELTKRTRIPAAAFIREGISRALKAYEHVLGNKHSVDIASPLALAACEEMERRNNELARQRQEITSTETGEANSG